MTIHIEMLLNEIADYEKSISYLKTNILNRRFPSEEDALTFGKTFKKDLTQSELFDIWQNADARRMEYYEEKKRVVQEKISSIRNEIQEELKGEKILLNKPKKIDNKKYLIDSFQKSNQEKKPWGLKESLEFAREESRRARRDWYEEGGGGNEWSSSPDE